MMGYYYEAIQKPTNFLFLKQQRSTLIYFLPKQNLGVDTTGAMMSGTECSSATFKWQIQHFTEFHSWELWQFAFGRIKIWN